MIRETCWNVAYFVLASLVVLLLLIPSPAQGKTCRTVCHTPVFHRPVYSSPVIVHTPITVKEVVPVIKRYVAVVPLLEIPTYSAIYVPPVVSITPSVVQAPVVSAAPPPWALEMMSTMRQMNEGMQRMDRRLRTVESVQNGPVLAPSSAKVETPPPMPKADVKESSTRSIFQVKCASCHESKVSADKGGGFSMFNGNTLVELNDKQMRRVITKVYGRQMPPESSGLTVSDEEVSKIVEHFSK